MWEPWHFTPYWPPRPVTLTALPLYIKCYSSSNSLKNLKFPILYAAKIKSREYDNVLPVHDNCTFPNTVINQKKIMVKWWLAGRNEEIGRIICSRATSPTTNLTRSNRGLKPVFAAGDQRLIAWIMEWYLLVASFRNSSKLLYWIVNPTDQNKILLAIPN
jgi:hypothetical protein